MILTKQYIQDYIKRNNIDISKPFRLDLSNKNIESIEAGAFDGLDNLEYLDLSDNNLTNVDNVFNGLVKLEYLYLDGNKLTNIENAFNGLVKLEVLYLCYNNLTNVDNAFNGLVKLEDLDLSNNNLTSVHISNNEELYVLYIDTKIKVYINKDQIRLIERSDITNYEVVGE